MVQVTTPALASLNNFFLSVQFQDPASAERIAPDVEVVALYHISADQNNPVAKTAADNLRRAAFDLPEIHSRVLGSALLDLGY